MITIYKYPLEMKSEQFLSIPFSSEIIDIQIQNNTPVLWAIVNKDSEKIDVKINMYATGQEIEGYCQKEVHTYLATVQIQSFVGHFFMVSERE